MSLTAELVSCLGCLLGREIALLPFGNREEHVGCGFGCAGHCTDIQAVCIFVQAPGWVRFRRPSSAVLAMETYGNLAESGNVVGHSQDSGLEKCEFAEEKSGAGEGNRTLIYEPSAV